MLNCVLSKNSSMYSVRSCDTARLPDLVHLAGRLSSTIKIGLPLAALVMDRKTTVQRMASAYEHKESRSAQPPQRSDISRFMPSRSPRRVQSLIHSSTAVGRFGRKKKRRLEERIPASRLLRNPAIPGHEGTPGESRLP